MKIRTSDLTGTALDWAVAKCEGFQLKADPMDFDIESANGGWWIWENASRGGKQARIGKGYSPSIKWSQGGRIIEREYIQTWKDNCSNDWLASAFGDTSMDRAGAPYDSGSTPLIAAMRCYVASKLGEEVEVPDEIA